MKGKIEYEIFKSKIVKIINELEKEIDEIKSVPHPDNDLLIVINSRIGALWQSIGVACAVIDWEEVDDDEIN